LLHQNSVDGDTGQSATLFTYMLHGLARAYTPEIRDVLCIGLGIGIVPMQFAREGARVEVVEINPVVAPVAERFFGFDPSQVNLTVGDGRYYLSRTTNTFDTIILDAFLGDSSPSHLMTREALASAKRRLNPRGTLVINMFGDFTSGADFFTASLERTLREVFRSVRIHAAGNGNVFFVASDRDSLQPLRPFSTAGVPRFLQPLADQAYRSTPRTDPAHGIVLSDNYNPVEVFDATNREEMRKRLALDLGNH
jgi:spermidine synthase